MQFTRLDNVSAANVEIILLKRLKNIVEGKVVIHQAREVHEDVVLFTLPAPGINLGNSCYRPQARFDDPIVNGGQLFKAVTFTGYNVVIDFAQARRNGAHRRPRYFLGKLHRLEALHHQLPGQVNIGPVLKNHRYLRQTEL